MTAMDCTLTPSVKRYQHSILTVSNVFALGLNYADIFRYCAANVAHGSSCKNTAGNYFAVIVNFRESRTIVKCGETRRRRSDHHRVITVNL